MITTSFLGSCDCHNPVKFSLVSLEVWKLFYQNRIVSLTSVRTDEGYTLKRNWYAIFYYAKLSLRFVPIITFESKNGRNNRFRIKSSILAYNPSHNKSLEDSENLLSNETGVVELSRLSFSLGKLEIQDTERFKLKFQLTYGCCYLKIVSKFQSIGFKKFMNLITHMLHYGFSKLPTCNSRTKIIIYLRRNIIVRLFAS